MQKGKLIIIGILLGTSSTLYAAGVTDVVPAEEIVTDNSVVQPVMADESPMQNHIIELMEKDFSYESKQRELSQELALEKLRSEIRKVRDEKKNLAAPAPMNVAADNNMDYQQMDDSVITAPILRALLISEIAGQKRVAVSAGNGAVKMVPLNQKFSYAGYDYIASHTQGDLIAVKELKK